MSIAGAPRATLRNRFQQPFDTTTLIRAELVFQVQERGALRRHRPLPVRDHAGDTDRGRRLRVPQLLRREHAEPIHLLTHEDRRVPFG